VSGPVRYFLENMKSLAERSYLDLDSYGRLFQHKGTRVSGDISPAYSTLNDEIIERVVNHFPNLKVVFLARRGKIWGRPSLGPILQHSIAAHFAGPRFQRKVK
jgi:hypothetical protein